MSEFDRDKFVSCFAKRTKQNLNLIDELTYIKTLPIEKQQEKLSKLLQEYKEINEVTQLVNSLFGLLILPIEKYDRLKNYQDIIQKEYKDIQSLIRELKDNYRLLNTYKHVYKKQLLDEDHYHVPSFLKHLRNALSHSGKDKLLFEGDGKELTTIIFIDEYQEDKKQFFRAEVKIDEVRDLTDYLLSMFSKIDELDKNDER